MNIDNLFLRMSALGINQAQISADTGISTGNLSDWKKGRSMPTSSKLVILADYLDCSIDYLLGRTTKIKTTAEPDEKAQQLLEIFYSFSNEGKDKLLEQAKMMQLFGAYNADSNVAKIAARSGNPDDVILTDVDGLSDAPDSI